MQWRRGVCQVVDDQLTPWLLPARRFYRQALRRGVSYKVMASFRAMVEGGWFTQAKLGAVGMVEDTRGTCNQAIGTLWHKMCACTHTEAIREKYCPPGTRRKARVRAWDPLLTRGVPAVSKIPKLPRGVTF